MSAVDQLASPSVLQKYGYYWQTLISNPRSMLNPDGRDTGVIRPSDAAVFSLFNLTLVVVLQDRVLFAEGMSPEAVASKVAIYALLSLTFWVVAGFAFVKGRCAGWIASLTASSAAAVLATAICSVALIGAVALANVGVEASFLQVDEIFSESGSHFSIVLNGSPIENERAYHLVLIGCALCVGVPTVARMSVRPMVASTAFALLFIMFAIWSYLVASNFGMVTLSAPSVEEGL